MGRNYLRVGDPVRVLASRAGRRDGFTARVDRLETDGAGALVEVHVVSRRGWRVVRPDRVRRVAVTRHGQPREALR